MTPFRLLALLVPAAVLALAATAFAFHGHRVYVPQGSVAGTSFRPKDIVISGDSSYIIDRVRYKTYGGGVARGTGRSNVEDCLPNCAQGHVFHNSVRIALSRVHKKCGRYYYGRIDLYWPGRHPKGFHRRDRRELGPFVCPK